MNIAIVKLSSLGDVVHALPVAATLRARLPGARLTWIAERRETVVLAGHPALEDVIAADTRGWRRAGAARVVASAAHGILELRRRLRTRRFDVAIDLQGLIKSGGITALTGASLRIGLESARCRERLAALFTNRRVRPPVAARHVVDQYLALLGPLGIDEPVREFTLPSDREAERRVEEFLAGVGLKPRNRLVVLNPGAGRPDKRWPVGHFGALARGLVDDAAAHVLVVWGPGEEGAARAIVERAGVGRALLAPPTDLHALIAVLRRAALVIAADTGPLHLAAALGTPCLGLYGPTRAERNGPYGPGHRALEGARRRVESISVEATLGAATELLG